MRLETFLIVHDQAAYANYLCGDVETYVKMVSEHKGSRFSQLSMLDTIHLQMSIDFKWQDQILYDTTHFELCIWDGLIEVAEHLSKESLCKVRLGIDPVMLTVEENIQGEVNWSVHDEFDTSEIYFSAKIPDKELLIRTIINAGIEFFTTLKKYGFQRKRYIIDCLRRLESIKD